MTRVHFTLFLLVSLSFACGTRVSLGELPGEHDSSDGTNVPTPRFAPRDTKQPDAGDAGDAGPAGPAPSTVDASDQDAGPAPYQPCAGKACGDPCTICAPTDPNCVEPAVLQECDQAGACKATSAVCS